MWLGGSGGRALVGLGSGAWAFIHVVRGIPAIGSMGGDDSD
jgi:hypothetical protein